MFLKNNIDLGFAKVGKNYTVKYLYKNIRTIDKVTASCDCITLEVDKDNHRLLVEWKPKPVPMHLKQAGQTYYETQKAITVNFTTEDKPDLPQLVTLMFTAKVTE